MVYAYNFPIDYYKHAITDLDFRDTKTQNKLTIAWIMQSFRAIQAPSYKPFFMLNSTEFEGSTAHKNWNTDK